MHNSNDENQNLEVPPAPGPVHPEATEQVEFCPICQTDDWVFKLWGKSRYTKFWYIYFRCQNCDLLAVNPRVPADRIEEIVHDQSYAVRKFLGESHFEELDFRLNIVKPLNRLLKKQDRPPQGLRWLDVGCAIGGLLKTAQKSGYLVHGMDLNKAKIEWMKEYRKEIPVTSGKFDDLSSDQKFDIISADNVLEHIHHPSSFLSEARERLNRNGILVIRIPNYNTLFRNVFEKRGTLEKSYLIDPDAHPYNYTPENLETLIINAGFRILKTDQRFVFSYPFRHILAGKTKGSPGWKISLAKSFHRIVSLFDGILPRGGVDVTVFAVRNSSDQ